MSGLACPTCGLAEKAAPRLPPLAELEIHENPEDPWTAAHFRLLPEDPHAKLLADQLNALLGTARKLREYVSYLLERLDDAQLSPRETTLLELLRAGWEVQIAQKPKPTRRRQAKTKKRRR